MTTPALRISEPGVYNMDAETYHADPVIEPSLSASGITTLVRECPQKYWWKNPRFNPEFEPKESTTFDIGKAAHLVFLEPDLYAEKVKVVQADDWRTNAAKEARELARHDGKVPLLTHQHAMIMQMHKALFENPIARHAFSGGGKAEQSAFFKFPLDDGSRGQIWGRIRPDWVPAHSKWLVDYKTAASANPDEFRRAVYNMAYYQRAAWYLQGWGYATGDFPETYFFVVQEKEAPYLATVITLDFSDLDAGREECRQGAQIFARCLAKGTGREHWPGYRNPNTPDQDTAFTVSMPGWAHQQIQANALAIQPKPNRSMAAVHARRSQEPLGELG